MNNYGGGNYSRTSYGAGGGEGDGGFVAYGSQGGSQSGGKSYSEETLRPVTIKQLIDAEQAFTDGPFRIDGIEVAQVTFVGMVRNVSPQTTNLTVRCDDGTGIIEAKLWLDPDKESSQNFSLDQYVRVWGRLKMFNNKRHIGAHVIKPITDFNEVNYNLLEATYVHLYFTKGAMMGGNGGQTANDDDSMFVDGGYGENGGNHNDQKSQNDSKLRNCGFHAKKLYNFLHNSIGGNEGVHVTLIAQGTGLSVQDVLVAAEELIAPGLIYTTVDDETFAILDY